MKSILLSLATLFMASTAAAQIYGLEVGFRQQSATATAAYQTAQSQNSYQAGLTGIFLLEGDLGIRSGLMYVARRVQLNTDGVSLASGNATVTMDYFDIPFQVAYKFGDYAYLYGGVDLAMNLDSNISGSGSLSSLTETGVKTPLLPFVLGATFKFAENFGAGVFFESQSGTVADNLKDFKAVGVNLLVTFD